MRFLQFIIGVALSFTCVHAQKQQKVDTYPLFQKEKCAEWSKEQLEECSTQNLMTYMASIKYPETAKKEKQEGKVFLKFVVAADGTIRNIEIAKSSNNVYLDRAALSHLSNAPKAWTPATRKGENIDFEYVLPVNFSL